MGTKSHGVTLHPGTSVRQSRGVTCSTWIREGGIWLAFHSDHGFSNSATFLLNEEGKPRRPFLFRRFCIASTTGGPLRVLSEKTGFGGPFTVMTDFGSHLLCCTMRTKSRGATFFSETSSLTILHFGVSKIFRF